MEKLSVLIFARNDSEKAMGLIRDVYSIADQIVVIDSSDKTNLTDFKDKVSKKGLEKVEIFHAIALGYADPLRAYGIKKCRNNWILYIDTDERLNAALKRNVLQIINKTSARAFAIKRYERAHMDGTKASFFTWQIRLYNKKYTYYKGLLHEQPTVDGKLERLAEKYSLLHIMELMQPRDMEYSQIEKFYRLTYEGFNRKALDYLSKFFVSEDKDFETTNLGRFVHNALFGYQKLKRKKQDEEISNLDYFLLYAIRDFAYAAKERNMEEFMKVIPFRIRYHKQLKKWRSEHNSRKVFEISKILERKGIIKYLHLDNEKVIEKLNKKYANRKQGIDLLMKLLIKRYDGDYP